MMMKSAEDRHSCDAAYVLDGAMDRICKETDESSTQADCPNLKLRVSLGQHPVGIGNIPHRDWEHTAPYWVSSWREYILYCTPGHSSMPRYFFPVRCENLSIDDERGQEFSTLDAATAHAAVVAGELARDGRVYEDCTVCVVDETGAEVARVAIDVE
jgi:hypothetical protein